MNYEPENQREGHIVKVWLPEEHQFNRELAEYFENLWSNIRLDVTPDQVRNIMETFREWLLDWESNYQLNHRRTAQ